MAYFNSSLYDSGNNLTFEVNPDFGGSIAKEYANTVTESLGGVEYSFQQHTGKKITIKLRYFPSICFEQIKKCNSVTI